MLNIRRFLYKFSYNRLDFFRLSVFHRSKIPETPYIYEIEPTNYCPYTCIMCPRGLGKMTRKTGFMSMDLFKRILPMFACEQQIVRLHHFGEAVLHPEIDTMIKLVNGAGLISVVSLNPSTLNEALCRKIINAGPGLVCFSLDAFTDEGLQKIRGIKKSFGECMDMLDFFVQESRLSKFNILKVIQTVALDENSSHFDQKAGLERLKEKYNAYDILFYAAENTGFGDIDLAEKTKTGSRRALLKKAHPCAAPFFEVSILWNGDVVLCCYDYDGFNVIGNIKDNTLQEIWCDEKIKNIRKMFLDSRTDELKLCSRCFLGPHNFKKRIKLRGKAWKEEQMVLDSLIASVKTR